MDWVERQINDDAVFPSQIVTGFNELVGTSHLSPLFLSSLSLPLIPFSSPPTLLLFSPPSILLLPYPSSLPLSPLPLVPPPLPSLSSSISPLPLPPISQVLHFRGTLFSYARRSSLDCTLCLYKCTFITSTS